MIEVKYSVVILGKKKEKVCKYCGFPSNGNFAVVECRRRMWTLEVFSWCKDHKIQARTEAETNARKLNSSPLRFRRYL